MNKVFYDRVLYLPMEWNVYHGNGNTDDFFPNLNFSTYMRFLSARKRPKMIHYAGENKPWNDPSVDYYDNFAKYAVGTPWQKELYERLNGVLNTAPFKQKPVLFQTRLKRQLIPLLNRCAPMGSSRRQTLSKYYYKLRRIMLG